MQEKSGAALTSEILPSPLLLGTDGQKGRAAEMVMKSPARDYRSCCNDGCLFVAELEFVGSGAVVRRTEEDVAKRTSRGPSRRC
ncbi:hypothetical protein FF1_043214 [Malus domestica]